MDEKHRAGRELHERRLVSIENDVAERRIQRILQRKWDTSPQKGSLCSHQMDVLRTIQTGEIFQEELETDQCRC